MGVSGAKDLQGRVGIKVEKRFLKAVRSSGLVPDAKLTHALEVQSFAARQGRELPLDRILLKLNLLDREQILGLWRALRYYVWRKEDKFYVKIAIQSAILTRETGKLCLKEQKKAYKHENILIRVNEIARQRGYLNNKEDEAIVRAMHEKHAELTLSPVDDDTAGEPFEPRSKGAASEADGDEWRSEARQNDLAELRGKITSSGEISGISDEDLDALWEEADLDDVELDSQAVEIANAPLMDDDFDFEIDDDDLF